MAAALGQAAVAAIIAWSTVYLERAAASLAEQKAEIQPELLAHLSPLGWEPNGRLYLARKQTRCSGPTARYFPAVTNSPGRCASM